ncbi:MAG: monovalent cation/H+ antiporter subunit D family protein [Desulfonatronovibrio sp. MSAO_Bac4]|nr:MAG: monovalent cation/H+ antiporter subunit D family protein [Desulfonatronovibrio sp. MSAO_Bac4]
MNTSNIPVLIPAVFMFAALLVPLVGLWKKSLSIYPALLGSLLAAWFSASGLMSTIEHGPISYHLSGWVPPLGIEYILDPLSAFICLVITSISTIVIFYSRSIVRFETPEKEMPFYALCMLFLMGLTGMVMTGDFFNLYVFLEISALAGYALIAIGDKRAPVAAFKYLTLGTAGAAFYLLGVSFIFISTGTLNMGDVASVIHLVDHTVPVMIGLSLIVLGTGLKMAMFPMHAWMPDAYTYASSAATALIAPIGTKVSAYVLLRIMFDVFEPSYSAGELPLAQIVGYLGAIGVIWGSILAICQKELKTMLAYSSVAQVGYIGIGIGLASPLGFIGAVLHILNHACMKACLFLISGSMRFRLGHSWIPKFENSLRITMPWTAVAFVVAAISMIGLPPTAGFFSKWYLALGSIEQGAWIFLIVLLVSSLLNAVYFFRIIEKMYIRPQSEEMIKAQDQDGTPVWGRKEAPWSMLAPVMLLATLLIVLGIFNVWIVTNFIEFMIPIGL